MATIAEWATGPGGERPNALINLGCFSSTPESGTGLTFNTELAGLLAHDGIAVYGPPHAGVVTAANWYSAWKSHFSQPLESSGALTDVPIQFQRIAPAKVVLSKRSSPTAPSNSTMFGTLVITNDCSLASEISGFSPNFSEQRVHEFDRGLME